MSNWKSGGFCLWAGCNQIRKQTIKLLIYHQHGTLHSLLITEWRSKSGFREGFDCDVNIKSLRRLSLCPGIFLVALETLLWNKVERILTAPSEGLSASSSYIPALHTLCSFRDGWDHSKARAAWRLRWNEDPSSDSSTSHNEDNQQGSSLRCRGLKLLQKETMFPLAKAGISGVS